MIKRKERRNSLFMLIIFLASLMPTHRAFACSCMIPDLPEQEFAASAAVFHGKAAETSRSSMGFFTSLRLRFGLGDIFGYEQTVVFDVIESWKGVDTTWVSIKTGYNDGDCGYTFTKGSEYIIYAREYDGDLHTSICSRTRSILSAAADDMLYLSGKTPLTLTSVEGLGGINWVWVGLPALLVAGIFWRRWKERFKSME